MTGTETKTRTHALKTSVQDLCDAGVRKTTFYPLIAESLVETLDLPRQIRRAKAFAYLLDNVIQTVLPYELLGGSIIGMWPLVEDVPYEDNLKAAYEAVENEINPKKQEPEKELVEGLSFEARVNRRFLSRFALMARDHYNANIRYSDMQNIIKELKIHYKGNDKIQPYTIGKVMEKFFVFDYGDDVMNLINELPWISANHTHLNYGMVINTGFGALLDKTAKLLKKATDTGDAEKEEFYTAVKISLEAVIRYITRYSDEYKKAADEEADPDRATELEEISSLLKKAATEKAGSFREAMQLMWITHIIASINLGSAMSFARFDQYMYPFYKADIDAGQITEDEARELIVHMILKVNEPKMRTVQSLALGGTTPDGLDATNDLTRIILEAAREVKMPYPNISLRVAGELTPDWAYDEAIKTIKAGFGMPMLVNDDVWIKNFESLGYPVEYAREYYNMGCVEMMIQNRQAHWLGELGNTVTFPVILDSILTDHADNKLTVDNFEDIMTEMTIRIKKLVKTFGGETAKRYIEENHRYAYDPFGSALIYNCLDKGKDMYHRGSELPSQMPIGGSGLGTAVDSLSVIKTMVYDRKEINLADLTKIVKSNFKGNEALRLKLSNIANRYGNDDDAVDSIAQKLFLTATEAVHSLNDGTNEDKFVNSYFSYTAHVSFGETLGATPDGRKAGEPLSDGLGPVQGKDIEGPTKLFNSLLKLDYRHLTGANATNLKISPSIMGTKTGVLAFRNLLKAFLADGGPQIQINMVRQEDLIEAQTNPSKHRDIVVRIAGFCEYFVNLDYSQKTR